LVDGRLSVSTCLIVLFFVDSFLLTEIVFYLPFFFSYPIFELWNVFSRGVIIFASTVMYPEKRWYTHITVMSVSLFITAAARPYVDKESNMVSILFCIIDILGAISAWQSSNTFLMMRDDKDILLNNKPTPGFQIIFVLALLIALIVVIVLACKATGERIRILNDAMLQGTDNRAIWKAYTTCEVIFLFPILVIIFVVSLIAKVLCCNQKRKKRKRLTTVVPEMKNSTKPEDRIIEEDNNESTGEKNKNKNTEAVSESYDTKSQSTKVVPIVKETICTKLLTVRIVGGPHTGLVLEHVLKESCKQMYVIGGDDEECDIVLDEDEDISGEHAVIYWDGFVLSFTDSDSTNGSKVNGKDALPEVSIMLKAENEIFIGETILMVVMKEAELIKNTETVVDDGPLHWDI